MARAATTIALAIPAPSSEGDRGPRFNSDSGAREASDVRKTGGGDEGGNT